MEILFLPQLEVSECALMLLCKPLWGGGRRWREAGAPTGPGLLRTVAAFIFHSQSIVLTAEKTVRGCSSCRITAHADRHGNVTERASPSSPSCAATQPLRCQEGHVSDVLLFLFSVCWLSLWFVSLFHKRPSSVSSREKHGHSRGTAVGSACLSLQCSDSALYYRTVAVASVESSIVGLCSFAELYLDFALIHVSSVLSNSRIDQIIVFKSFLLFNVALLCKIFLGP